MLSKIFLGYVQWIYFGNMLLVLGTYMENDGVYAGYIGTLSLGMAGHITGIFWIHFWQHFECYLVGTCRAYVEIKV